MTNQKALWGAAAGVIIALVWVAFDGLAVLLVVGLAALGWAIGMVFDRPDAIISLLERIRDR
ncbi:MAG: hypothetical protein U5R31_13360 [Acidimicrobiia bacterium]|nr:hypothetical protein [Acidimicrobiia bacterium]